MEIYLYGINFRTIISMEPKDPLIVVKCAKTLMTLPAMVRDFKLGKQYLTKALEMAPNDITVLKAVSNAVEAYKGLVRLHFVIYFYYRVVS